jgi:tetratricopeptide (TPR) repeat protein
MPTKKVTPKKQEEPANTEQPSDHNFAAMGKYLEQSGKPAEAAKYYEQEIKMNPTDRTHYNRLMVIYRKLKDVKNEVRVIDAGIKAFTSFYAPKASKNTNVVKLSNKLNFLVGLTDKKGKTIHDPEPIATWKKRKQLLLNRKTKR